MMSSAHPKMDAEQRFDLVIYGGTAGDNDRVLTLYRAMDYEEFSKVIQTWFIEDRSYRES